MKTTSSTRTLLVVIAVFWCGAVVCAQPESLEPEPIAPELVLDLLGQAYAGQPVTDHLLVSLRLPGKPMRRGRITIQIEPGDRGPSMPRRVALELGNLQIEANSKRIIAGLIENDSECVLQESEEGESIGEALARLLPPLPIPHLDLLGFCGSARTLTPYVANPVWTKGTSSPDLVVPVFELVGESDAGPISLRIDAETGRLMKFTATLAGSDFESGDGELVIEVSPAGTGEMIQWTLRAEGRTRVDSIRQLGGGTNRISQGGRVPDIHLLDLDMEPWSLVETMVRRADADYIIFLPFELGNGPEIDQLNLADAVTGLRVIRKVIDSVVIEPVAVVGLAELQADRLEGISRFWAAAAGDDPVATPQALLFGTAPARLIDPFIPDAGTLMIVIDRQRRLVVAIDLTARAGQEDQIEVELREALDISSGEAPRPEGD